MALEAVIFDLDGVLTDTACFHFLAWKCIAERENIYFDEAINERLKGVSRTESLEIILERANRPYSPQEKAQLAQEKNRCYVDSLDALTPEHILPGIRELMNALDKRGIKRGVFSASRNTDRILARLDIRSAFHAVVTGNDVERAKPDPEGFLLAAARLCVQPKCCAVIEDAYAGLQGAKSANMKAIGIGDPKTLTIADIVLPATDVLNLDVLYSLFSESICCYD